VRRDSPETARLRQRGVINAMILARNAFGALVDQHVPSGAFTRHRRGL